MVPLTHARCYLSGHRCLPDLYLGNSHEHVTGGFYRTGWGCCQWGIQDFQNGGANPEFGVNNLLFGKIFAEKLHENQRNWTGGASLSTPWIRQCWSLLALLLLIILITDCVSVTMKW